MEVVIPARAAMDFNFDSACSSPYISAPSSPKRFGEFYFSAPTSPARVSAVYRDFNDFSHSSSAIPFDWEEKPGTPKSKAAGNNDDDEDEDDDFAFDFRGQHERASLSAEDLFDGGVIRPLKPPPCLQLGDEASTWKSPVSSPRSPRSPISQGKKMIREAFSPRQKKDFDPFAAAIEEARKGSDRSRGRERAPVSVSTKSGRKGTRSVSPLRVSEFAWEEQQQLQQQQQQQQQQENTKSTPSMSKQSSSSSTSSLKGSRKWKLKDWLLFRSASEGRASEKDPLRKYAALPKKKQQQQEDVKNASFRSTDSTGSTSRRRGPVSAHALHYTTNRAVAEDMRRKTFLPYRQGLLGCLGFNPTVNGLTRTFG